MAAGFDVQFDGTLATITLQLPGKVNKINADFARGLAEATTDGGSRPCDGRTKCHRLGQRPVMPA